MRFDVTDYNFRRIPFSVQADVACHKRRERLASDAVEFLIIRVDCEIADHGEADATEGILPVSLEKQLANAKEDIFARPTQSQEQCR